VSLRSENLNYAFGRAVTDVELRGYDPGIQQNQYNRQLEHGPDPRTLRQKSSSSGCSWCPPASFVGVSRINQSYCRRSLPGEFQRFRAGCLWMPTPP
jgi:hypothetical protein